MTETNPLVELTKLGQSIWYDQMQRSLVTEGTLQEMIEKHDLRGLTSNPTIFEKAIGGSSEYDLSLGELARKNKTDDEILEGLMVEDIGAAADVFRPVYEKTGGLDGFVSIEVSPTLAHDTAETIEEGAKLFSLLDRPNVMIKVPATSDGLPAIEELISRGINVNVTLIFSRSVYAQVIEAYLRGLERRLAEGKPLDRICSVASFFVSRIDSKVDAALEKKIAATADAAEKAKLSALLGKVAVANAKLAYKLFREIFGSPRFAKLAAAGANVQRPLWASTGTKNPSYRDVLYIEELIGSDTVNTVPPATYKAFLDHGRVEPTLERGMDEAERVLRELESAGISLDQITDDLTREGVKSFSESFVSLMETIESRRDVILRHDDRREMLHIDAAQKVVHDGIARVGAEKITSRIWKKDASLWKSDEASKKQIANSLGWLSVPSLMQAKVAEVRSFAEETRGRFDHVVLLGMGGSSLCAEVLRRSFGKQKEWPELHVLDSTVPAAVIALEAAIDYKRTLFIVASKSGTTIEPSTFFRYFFERTREVVGAQAGRHFVAITDPDTLLQRQAEEAGFLRVFLNPADIGGRYSALSLFGLVPAALAGIDVEKFLDRAVHAQHACSDRIPADQNPGVLLGATVGALAAAGRDKLTLITSGGIASLGLWIEQLVAESSGKEGKGIVPVAGEPIVDASAYSEDRLFVVIRLADEDDHDLSAKVRELSRTHPVIEMRLRDLYDLADAFYVWEFATAVAGFFTAINPFDQPNVQESKDNTGQLLTAYGRDGFITATVETAVNGDLRAHASNIKGSSLAELLGNLLASVRQGDYFAITQYIAENAGHDKLIRELREVVLKATGVATTSGYGPRFLHSTGQLHKGGGDNGVFLQITADDVQDVAIPQQPYSFAVLKDAQATGDFQALASRGRRAVSVRLGIDTFAGLRQLLAATEQAAGAKK